MAIKVALQELYSFLETNQNAKVKDIFATITELATSNKGGGGGGNNTVYHPTLIRTVKIKLADGSFADEQRPEPVIQFCNFAKQWCFIGDGEGQVPFGAKAQNRSGLNGQCLTGEAMYGRHHSELEKLAKGVASRMVKHATADASEENGIDDKHPDFYSVNVMIAEKEALQKKHAKEQAEFMASFENGFTGTSGNPEKDKDEGLRLILAEADARGVEYTAPKA